MGLNRVCVSLSHTFPFVIVLCVMNTFLDVVKPGTGLNILLQYISVMGFIKPVYIANS